MTSLLPQGAVRLILTLVLKTTTSEIVDWDQPIEAPRRRKYWDLGTEKISSFNSTIPPKLLRRLWIGISQSKLLVNENFRILAQKK